MPTPDKKPGFALLIAGKPKGKPKDDGPMGLSDDEHADDLGAEDMDKDKAEDSAAKDACEACSRGDVAMFKAAMKDFIALQEPDGDEDDSKEEDSEEV